MPKEISSTPVVEKLNLEPNKAEKRISQTEAEVFRRLIPKFEKLRINPQEFKGVYTESEINRDLESVRRKKETIERAATGPTQRAQVLEALLAEQVELSNWLGQNAMTIVPAEYDDLYHGVDLATEFEHDETLQHLAMGIDVTTSPGSIEDKLTRIRDHLVDGSLTEMKYFTSERLPDFHGRMANIPLTVIGADARTINELAELWLTVDRSKNPPPGTTLYEIEELRERAKEAQQKLANHRIQVLILKEIELQLETFLAYSGKIKKEEVKKIINKIENLLVLVKDILKGKKISTPDVKSNESDDVFQAIQKKLDIIFT